MALRLTHRSEARHAGSSAWPVVFFSGMALLHRTNGCQGFVRPLSRGHITASERVHSCCPSTARLRPLCDAATPIGLRSTVLLPRPLGRATSQRNQAMHGQVSAPFGALRSGFSSIPAKALNVSSPRPSSPLPLPPHGVIGCEECRMTMSPMCHGCSSTHRALTQPVRVDSTAHPRVGLVSLFGASNREPSLL